MQWNIIILLLHSIGPWVRVRVRVRRESEQHTAGLARPRVPRCCFEMRKSDVRSKLTRASQEFKILYAGGGTQAA